MIPYYTSSRNSLFDLKFYLFSIESAHSILLREVNPPKVFLSHQEKYGKPLGDLFWHKKSRKANLSAFLIQLPYSSGLADLVDGSGEVDHLVGEAPLVVTRSS